MVRRFGARSTDHDAVRDDEVNEDARARAPLLTPFSSIFPFTSSVLQQEPAPPLCNRYQALLVLIVLLVLGLLSCMVLCSCALLQMQDRTFTKVPGSEDQWTSLLVSAPRNSLVSAAQRSTYSVGSVERCPIHTYFQLWIPSEQLSQRESLKLTTWAAWYYSRGWMPRVLSAADASSFPNVTELTQHFGSLPTINMKEMEKSCYVRWMALAAQGGGLFLDYDIFDLSYTPAFPELGSAVCEYDRLTSYYNHFPMVTHGNSSEVAKWVRAMAEYHVQADDVIDGRAHISDMLMAARLQDKQKSPFEKRPGIPWYHFSHHAMRQLESYAPYPAFASRILQLHFLSYHRLRAINGRSDTLALARALTLCRFDGFAGMENLCLLNFHNASSERDRERVRLCSLLSPRPWTLSHLQCRFDPWDLENTARTDADLVSDCAERTSHTLPSDVVVVGILADPILHVLRQLRECCDQQLQMANGTIEEWTSLLQRTTPNPLLFQLTHHLPRCTSLAERWSAAEQLLTGPFPSLLLAEADVPSSSAALRDLVSRSLGFSPLSVDDEWPHFLPQSALKQKLAAPETLVTSIRNKHALDMELYRLVRERTAVRAKVWEEHIMVSIHRSLQAGDHQ